MIEYLEHDINCGWFDSGNLIADNLMNFKLDTDVILKLWLIITQP